MRRVHFFVFAYVLLLISHSGCLTRRAGMTRSNPGTSALRAPALRVGTAGDYPPLTSYDSISKQFSGEDIDLARELGRRLGRPVIFILTTWKGLSGDLDSRKFDMAIGGITINAERQCCFVAMTASVTGI
jgi:cyclohexadienyl dehydratase